MKEPTAKQCSDNEKVFENEDKVGYAIWYPQMGGYVGKAIAVLDRKWEDHEKSGIKIGGCMDVFVWHNGEFPFEDEDGPPREIHHCSPEQFIEFGEKLRDLNNRHRVEV